MSPESGPTALVAFRIAGLRDTRRWLIGLLLSEAWLFAAVYGFLQWAQLPTVDRLALTCAAACLVAGWAAFRHAAGLWLITCAPLLLVVAAASCSTSSPQARWIALTVSAGHVAYALVLLTPRVTGLAAIAAAAAIVAVVWSRRPADVVPGPLVVAGGWIAVAGLTVAALTLWAVWHSLSDNASAEDGAASRRSERIAAEIAAQEASRMWRAAAVQVHERLLSTLRYLLQTQSVDRAGLADLQARAGADAPPGAPEESEDLAAQVRKSTAARIAAGIVHLDRSAIDLPVTEQVRAAYRAALVECALNAVLHGGATEVVVTAARQGDTWHVAISDDGRGLPPGAVAGRGWTAVLDDGLSAVGGSWSITRVDGRTIVTLALPDASSSSLLSSTHDGFQQGRILMSAPLMAVGVVGLVYDLVAVGGSFGGGLVAGEALMATLAGLLIVWRGKRPYLRGSSAVLLGLAAIPWLMAMATPQADGAAAAAGMTAAGYAVIAVGVRCRPWQWVAAMVIWALGVVRVASLDAGTARLALTIALVNCLVIVPVVLVVSRLGARRFVRAQEALAVERSVVSREAIRASTAQLIDVQLSACVHQAEQIIADIATGAPLTDDRRHQVACLEGLIRATIQVDPLTSGEFPRAAARLVNSAFSRSIPAEVGTLMASTSREPLPVEVLLALEQRIAQAESIAVRVFTDGTADYLALELRAMSGSYRAIGTLEDVLVDGVGLSVERVDGTSLLLLTRRLDTDVSPVPSGLPVAS